MLTSVQDIKILTRHPIVLGYYHTKFRDSSYTRIIKSQNWVRYQGHLKFILIEFCFLIHFISRMFCSGHYFISR